MGIVVFATYNCFINQEFILFGIINTDCAYRNCELKFYKIYPKMNRKRKTLFRKILINNIAIDLKESVLYFNILVV